jgi:hypothetical protein
MPITDKVNVPYLDQSYRWQCLPSSPCCSDAQPASLVVILERVEVAVKVIAATSTTTDLTDRHRPYPGIAASVYCTGGLDLIEIEQAA